MPITLTFNDNDIPLLKEFFEWKKSQLYKEANDIENLLHRIQRNGASSPHSESGSKQLSINEINGYSIGWTWLDKVKYLIDKCGGAATTAELVDKFFEFEPNFKNNRPKIVSRLSAILSINSKDDGTIDKHKNDRNEYVFTVKK